mmetsp:Transcript_9778/g.29115  ORF Transcript_9778/g.29115 Transcript_9778/m.29115 type:complete len:270 (+) Transcript_9778:647-1456(+)
MNHGSGESSSSSSANLASSSQYCLSSKSFSPNSFSNLVSTGFGIPMISTDMRRLTSEERENESLISTTLARRTFSRGGLGNNAVTSETTPASLSASPSPSASVSSFVFFAARASAASCTRSTTRMRADTTATYSALAVIWCGSELAEMSSWLRRTSEATRDGDTKPATAAAWLIRDIMIPWDPSSSLLAWTALVNRLRLAGPMKGYEKYSRYSGSVNCQYPTPSVQKTYMDKPLTNMVPKPKEIMAVSEMLFMERTMERTMPRAITADP